MKQTDENYSTHITSLSSRESGRQISANTIRILLLEEQNSELRQKVVEAAHGRARQREGAGVEQEVFQVGTQKGGCLLVLYSRGLKREKQDSCLPKSHQGH